MNEACQQLNGGALEGIRVLDLSRSLAGPYCTRLLCDLGAEIIKVEPPPGDPSRQFVYLIDDGISGYYIQQNVGKRGVCLDLRYESGKQVLRDLVKVSDVIIENYRTGVLARLGLDYAAIQKINPTIVICSITAFGHVSPYSHRRAGDPNVQAMSGLAMLNGDNQGRPQLVATAVGDTFAGCHAFGAICAALYRRTVTGKGQLIDLSMLDCLIFQNEWAFQYYLLSGGANWPKTRRPAMNPGGIFRGRDGYVTLAAATQPGWENLTRAMKRPDLAKDPRFVTLKDREQRNEELHEIIEDWVQTFPTIQDVVKQLADLGSVQCSIVLSVAEVLKDPHMAARELLVDVIDPVVGKMQVLNTPFKFSEDPVGLRGPAPLRGEHTAYVVRSLLGIPKERILGLIGEGSVLVEERAVEGVLRDLNA